MSWNPNQQDVINSAFHIAWAQRVIALEYGHKVSFFAKGKQLLKFGARTDVGTERRTLAYLIFS